MTYQLPRPVSCIALGHIIDDPDAVEGYLAQDERTAECFPIILRDLFLNRSTKWNLGKCNTIPDAQTTLNYLNVLWSDADIPSKIKTTSELGLTHLLPYLLHESVVYPVNDGTWKKVMSLYSIPNIDDPIQNALTQGLILAVRNGHIDTVRLLHGMGAQTAYIENVGGYYKNQHEIYDAIREAGTRGDLPMVLILLNLEPTVRKENLYRALQSAAGVDQLEMIKALTSLYPNDLNGDMYRSVWLRAINDQTSVRQWLRNPEIMDRFKYP